MRPAETESGSVPLLSIVIPARNEENGIVSALEALAGWERCEILVVSDRDSNDATAALAARAPGVRLIESPAPGRGATLSAGASEARGRFLLFLHADSRLAEAPVRSALGSLGGDTVAAAFRIRLDSPRPVFRLLEAGINLRSRLLGLPYGDQGLLISREILERSGGFRPLPRCEDLDLVLRLRRLGRIAIAPGPCTTSTRRWDSEGVLAVTARNLFTLARFLFTGTIPEGATDHVPEPPASRGDHGREPASVDLRRPDGDRMPEIGVRVPEPSSAERRPVRG